MVMTGADPEAPAPTRQKTAPASLRRLRIVFGASPENFATSTRLRTCRAMRHCTSPNVANSPPEQAVSIFYLSLRKGNRRIVELQLK
jgi:hypothetical protein